MFSKALFSLFFYIVYALLIRQVYLFTNRNIIVLLSSFYLSITAVGFTTKLPTTTYSSKSSNIRGSPIFYNGGNAYNGTVFTCPSPGLYLFHVSLLTSTKYGGIWIYKNSQQLTLAYAGHNPQWDGASVSAAVWLDVGDHVYLRPFSSSLYVDRNSAFTGVKIN